jgi:serpin B
MKKKACLAMAAVFAAAALTGCGSQTARVDTSKISASVIDANNGFAFDIFRELDTEEGEGNIFISPISISTALAMVYEGAGGTTKEAMAEALNYKGIETDDLNESSRNLLLHLNSLDAKVDLSIKNSIWIRQGEEIKQSFTETNKEVFDAQVTELDFSKADAADTINRWISDSTQGKIDKMVSSPIDPLVVMYLINAIYFKGEWTTRFEEKNTFAAKFNSAEASQEDVMMMSMQSEMDYASEEGYRAVRMPYGSKKAAMYCILPDKGVDVNEFISGMDAAKWREIKESLASTTNVTIQMPRFRMEYGIKELRGALSDLGMGICFTEDADLTGIRNNLLISSVLHKAVIEVNEKGTEAAAVTSVEIKTTSAGETPEFIADRPFIFIIEDSVTGSILFMGKYSKV